jgi:hypothetical protein
MTRAEPVSRRKATNSTPHISTAREAQATTTSAWDSRHIHGIMRDTSGSVAIDWVCRAQVFDRLEVRLVVELTAISIVPRC